MKKRPVIVVEEMLHIVDFFLDELKRTARNPLRIGNLLSKSERKKYLHIVSLVCSYFIHRGNNSPKKTVQAGYDKIVYRYAILNAESEKRERQKSVTALMRATPKGLDLLDLGCGTGLPSTKALAEHFNVTGIDFSRKAIALAKQNIPDARFIQKDITEIDFPSASFDVITAFYSIFHIPRRQQPGVIEKMEALLRPGGIILATMGIRSIKVLFEHDWMGTQMYWSSFDSKKNLECFKKAGLHILSAREVQEKAFGKSNTFLWVVAKKPASADSGKEAIASELVRLLEEKD